MAPMRRYLGFLLAVIVLAFLVGAAPSSVRNDTKAMASQKAEDVSLIQLIADSKTYHHRRVRVVGYYYRGDEHSALYLHKEDYQHMITHNAIWIRSTQPTAQTLNDRYLLWEGVFNAEDHGHLAQYSGVIESAKPPVAWK